MKIEKIISQHRRDFTAVYKCEHCSLEVTKGGYDDNHFHAHVIPNMECTSCGMKAPPEYRPLQPKYEAHVVV